MRGARACWHPGGPFLGMGGASDWDGEGKGPIVGLHGLLLPFDKVRVPSDLGHVPGPKEVVEEQAGRESRSFLSGASLVGQ